MIIICPRCTARYHLKGGTAPAASAGRNLRCSRCGNTWQATRVEAPAEILPPELHRPRREDEGNLPHAGEPELRQARLVPGPAEEDAAARLRSGQGGEDAPPAYRAAWQSAESLRRRNRRAAAPRGRAFLLGMLLALVAAGLHYRIDVVRAVPSSAGLYELVGLTINLRGLAFRNIESRRSFEDGLPVLIIEGEIVNLRDVPVEVPRLRIAVLGDQAEQLYSWQMEPRQRVLGAAEAMNVRTRLAAPPSEARNVELRFVERGTADSLGSRR